MTAARTTRAERMAMPLARQVVTDLAAEHGACLRPVQLRRTEIDTGHVEQVLIPCGHTLASVCPSCAERARILRAAQCREGWHLDREPVIDPDPATEDQRELIADRAETQEGRDLLASEGLDISDLDTRIGEPDEQITDAGLRGTVLPARPRRHRSTRRRQDAAPCHDGRSARERSARPTPTGVRASSVHPEVIHPCGSQRGSRPPARPESLPPWACHAAAPVDSDHGMGSTGCRVRPLPSRWAASGSGPGRHRRRI